MWLVRRADRETDKLDERRVGKYVYNEYRWRCSTALGVSRQVTAPERTHRTQRATKYETPIAQPEATLVYTQEVGGSTPSPPI